MSTDAENHSKSGKQRRWVKPSLETIMLNPTDDVLGSCWTSNEVAPANGACNFVGSGCAE